MNSSLIHYSNNSAIPTELHMGCAWSHNNYLQLKTIYLPTHWLNKIFCIFTNFE